MLIQYTHYPTIVTEYKTQFFQKKKNFFFDYFKGLLMTHNLDIFMSGKKLGLNGLNCSRFVFF